MHERRLWQPSEIACPFAEARKPLPQSALISGAFARTSSTLAELRVEPTDTCRSRCRSDTRGAIARSSRLRGSARSGSATRRRARPMSGRRGSRRTTHPSTAPWTISDEAEIDGAIGLGEGFTEYSAMWLGPMSAATKSANAQRDGYVSTLRWGPEKKPGAVGFRAGTSACSPRRPCFAFASRSRGTTRRTGGTRRRS